MVWTNDSDREDEEKFKEGLSGILSSLTSHMSGGGGGDDNIFGDLSDDGKKRGGRKGVAGASKRGKEGNPQPRRAATAPKPAARKRAMAFEEDDSLSAFLEDDSASPQKRTRGAFAAASPPRGKLFDDENEMRKSFADSLKTDLANAISQDRTRRKQLVGQAAQAITKIIEAEKQWIEAECLKLQDMDAEYHELAQELTDLNSSAQKLEKIQREYDNAADAELQKIDAKKTATAEAFCKKLREVEASATGALKHVHRRALEKGRAHKAMEAEVEAGLAKKSKLATQLIRKIESIIPAAS